MNRGQLVKLVRSHMDLNQKDFGLKMGVCTTMVSKWENQVNKFEDSHVFELFYICDNFTSMNAVYVFKKFIDEIINKRVDK